jgi:beta-glucanase (GH16 family)
MLGRVRKTSSQLISTRRDIFKLAAGLFAGGAATKRASATRREEFQFLEEFQDPESFHRSWEIVEDSGNYPQLSLDSRAEREAVGLSENGLGLGVFRDAEHRKKFATGFVRTRDTFGPYGVYVCDMAIIESPGINNAFWLAGFRPNSTKRQHLFEIDVAEVHAPDKINVTSHFWPSGDLAKDLKNEQVVRVPKAAIYGLHRYSVRWSADYIAYMLDDREIWRTPNLGAHSPVHLALANAVISYLNGDRDYRGDELMVVRRVAVSSL